MDDYEYDYYEDDWSYDDYDYEENPDVDPATGKITTPDPSTLDDPYLYQNIFGSGTTAGGNWPDGSTPETVNDDTYNTNDTTQTGGFWEDLGKLFTDTAGSVLGNAVNTAGQTATAWTKKNLTPATTTTPAATTGGISTANMNLLLGLAAAGLALYLIMKKRA